MIRRRSVAAVRVTLVGIAILGIAGCGGKEAERAETPGVAEDRTLVEAESGLIRFEIRADDRMRYDVNRFSIPAGSRLRLVLINTGRMSREQMGHNWILLRPGTRVDAFILEASGAEVNGYIPDGWDDAMLAHTPMTGGGETVEITIDLPDKPGEYPYVCSFPGHYFAGMKGVLVLE